MLPGVTVEARSPRWSAWQPRRPTPGIYRFPALAPGIYEVTATLVRLHRRIKVANIQLAARTDPEGRLRAADRGRDRNRAGDGGIAAHRRQAERGRGSASRPSHRSHPEGPRLHVVLNSAPGTNANESAAAASMIDGATGVREPLHRRRPRHDHLRTGIVEHDRSGRLPPGSPGQVERLQRGVPRDDRRRDQRDHQVRQQRVPRRCRHLLQRQQVRLGDIRRRFV